MKTKSVSSLYKIECYIFQGINRYFDQNTLNIFFRTITHIGGAIFSISLALCFFIFSKGLLHHAAIAASLSLAISHIPVQLLKRWYPRKRPYLTIQDAKYPLHPLTDNRSFFSIWSHNSCFFCFRSTYLLSSKLNGHFTSSSAMCWNFSHLSRASLSIRCICRYVPWHMFWHHLFLSIHATFHVNNEKMRKQMGNATSTYACAQSNIKDLLT